MPKLMLVDGNSILNRAFYGIRPLTTKEGLPTNAVYGFLNILFKMNDDINPQYIAVAFDMAAKTFRNDMYSEYKANRKGMPDELALQLPVLKEVLKSLNISYIEKEGYEADDLIGTISDYCEKNKIECSIISGDKDDLQLSSDLTTVMLITSKAGKTLITPYDKEKVIETYGITPSQFIELKGLMGDSSDNIPGVKGIGEVTAMSLLKEFNDIENIYRNINSEKIKNSIRNKLIENKDMAYLSRSLGTIVRNVPIDINFSDFEYRAPDKEKVTELFNKLEFYSFLKRFNFETKIDKESAEIDYINDFAKLKDLKEEFYYLIYDNEIYINIDSSILRGNIEENVNFLKPIFENESIKKISYSIKEHIVYLDSLGIKYKNAFFDIKIASYVLNPSESDLRLSSIVYGSLKKNINEEIDAILFLNELYLSLYNQIKENKLDKLFSDIEMPIVSILAGMQIRGIKVDTQTLKELSLKFNNSLIEISANIYKLAGEEFNINSTKQLSIILFEKLGLKAVKKTKTGYSTDNAVLESLKDDHPIIAEIINYRTIAKLKSTYIDSILNICDKDNILHSNFHQTVTQTGRLSSSDPNLQNIPIKLELGRELRKVFTPVCKDNIFISADYSQIELRVMAQICGDENLIMAFKNNEDIHKNAASKIFNVPIGEVTEKMRSDAKTVNFGILYGKTEFTLAKDLGISRAEAKDIIDTYLNKYPNIKNYMENIVEYAKENGYVKTLLGRIRYIKELNDKNYMMRMFGERIALNTPIQGTAADIMKIAMIKTENRLKEENLDARIVLQIHDEIIIEAKEEIKDRVIFILKDSMENAIKLNVPLTVQVSFGKNLFELK